MNENLLLIPGTEEAQSLERAEAELRESAKNLTFKIESTYWELGKVLYEVYDGLPGGWRASVAGDQRAARQGLFIKWGYTSFDDYCEQEVGLRRRTASNLRHAYWWFEHHLKLPSELKDRIKRLGRSKLYVLAGFVEDEDVLTWMEKAEDMTIDELKKARKQAEALKLRQPTDDNNDLFSMTKERALADPEFDQEGHRSVPAPEVTHQLTTSMYDGQWDTWNNALERAKSVTGSEKISHNLEMICQDFLATNDWAKPEADTQLYLKKLEKQLGLQLIAIDPQSGQCKYGADLLWAMVNTRKEFNEAEASAIDVDSTPVEPETPDGGMPKLKIVPVEDDQEPPPAF